MKYEKYYSEKSRSLGLISERFYVSGISERAEEACNEAKEEHRTDMKLSDWSKLNYFNDNWCERMLSEPPKGVLQVDIEDYDTLTIELFRKKYEKINKPLIIKNATKTWPAQKSWTFENLYREYKESKVKVGEDDEGYKIKMRFKYFLEYLIYNKDDSPLYLFESSIENHKDLNNIIKEYEVPKFFKEDFFNLVSNFKNNY